MLLPTLPSTFARAATPALILLLTVPFIAAGCTPVTDWVPAKTEIGKRVELPLMLAPNGIPFVALDGSTHADPREGSYGMIDTGAGVSIVTQRFVAARGLKRRGEPRMALYD